MFFIGGIHGVGKSTVCDQLCRVQNLNHLSASNLIKWSEINEDPRNKKVFDIDNTQRKLLTGLKEKVEVDKNYLLDGHFCLLDRDTKVSRIPLSLFKGINPDLLCIISGNIQEIKENIELRDKRTYDYDLLFEMQEKELENAKYIASELSINLICGTKENFYEIQKTINGILNENTFRH